MVAAKTVPNQAKLPQNQPKPPKTTQNRPNASQLENTKEGPPWTPQELSFGTPKTS